MPTYDYVCTKCGHEMEVFHPVHAHGPSVCPRCGGQMRKAFAPPTVVYKGTGWARKERSSPPGRKKESDERSGDKSGEDKPRSEHSEGSGSPAKDGD